MEQLTTQPMKRTALYDKHIALGAKMTGFGGWEMPVQYSGIIKEHQCVRNGVGIFDVSHMGRICVDGLDAERFLDYLSTNQIAGKKEGTATYTVWCHKDGGCVDDVIIYKKSSTSLFVVVNAGNRDKDLAHLIAHSSGYDITITDRYDDDGLLAIQGPKAIGVVAKLFPVIANMRPFHFAAADYNGTEVILSTTGYTGSGGCEIYAPNSVISSLWDALMNAGKECNIAPIGLGARDTLRLEMGYALYGHELADDIRANETVSEWTIKMNKNFLGKEALKQPAERHEYGIILQDRGIAREGYSVNHEGKEVGHVTSGTQSPSLNQAIAIVLVSTKLQEGDTLEVNIRNRPCEAVVTKLPFYNKT